MATKGDIILKSNNRNGKVVTRNAVDRAWDAIASQIKGLFIGQAAFVTEEGTIRSRTANAQDGRFLGNRKNEKRAKAKK